MPLWPWLWLMGDAVVVAVWRGVMVRCGVAVMRAVMIHMPFVV